MMASTKYTEISKIYEAFQTGKIKKLENHEVNPGLPKDSRENYLYFFLSCTINFRRSSPALWKSSLATWQDPETNYVFYPELLVKHSFEQVQKAMTKHSLAIQTNKHPEIWIKISTTLNEHYSNDPREVLKEGNYEISKIIPLIQKDKKHLFPYLSGIKLSNYTMMVLNWHTNANFKDLYNLSIVPDTHIINASKKLGLVGLTAKPIDVEQAWRPILKKLDYSPHLMHSALWHWSRNGFNAL